MPETLPEWMWFTFFVVAAAYSWIMIGLAAWRSLRRSWREYQRHQREVEAYVRYMKAMEDA